MITRWTPITPAHGRRRGRSRGGTPASRDEDELDVAATRLALPRGADPIQRHGLRLEMDRAGDRVPDEVGVALGEQVKRNGEVRVAEEAELLPTKSAGCD